MLCWRLGQRHGTIDKVAGPASEALIMTTLSCS